MISIRTADSISFCIALLYGDIQKTDRSMDLSDFFMEVSQRNSSKLSAKGVFLPNKRRFFRLVCSIYIEPFNLHFQFHCGKIDKENCAVNNAMAVECRLHVH